MCSHITEQVGAPVPPLKGLQHGQGGVPPEAKQTQCSGRPHKACKQVATAVVWVTSQTVRCVAARPHLANQLGVLRAMRLALAAGVDLVA